MENKPISLITSFHRAYCLLDKTERVRFLFLLPGIFLMGILNVVGVAFVVPFMAIVLDPTTVTRYRILSQLYALFHFSDVLVLGDLFSIVINWWIYQYANFCGGTLSQRLFKKYLSKPYVYFLNHNSADLEQNILSETKNVVAGIISPAIQLISYTVGILLILILLFVANPFLALWTLLISGMSLVLVIFTTRKLLHRINVERYRDMQRQFRIVSETFGGIKEVKLMGKEEKFLGLCSHPTMRLASNTALMNIVSVSPKYLLEIIAFGGVVLIVLYLLAVNTSFTSILPMLALYVFAGYRLMPLLQGIFGSVTFIKGYNKPLEIIHHDLTLDLPDNHRQQCSTQVSNIEFNHQLQLSSVSYAYPNSKEDVLHGVSLTVKANEIVAFVGVTGAGKTTIADIILGLLEPQQGKVIIDGVALDDTNRRSWQHQLGYVPQHIYLSDNTIAANIAFGVPEEEIDYESVQQAARVANLHGFIETELPDQYHTIIGERGVRLSGGQRQRIGIARALYHNPKILVLDEATSALDGITETAIMDAIHNLAHKKTIIVIAHRLTTVRECDIIYLMEKGKIIDQGVYNDLLERNESFKKMAKTK
jgi:ABC-type multidrug transport system fused ATPase/permease subunit